MKKLGKMKILIIAALAAIALAGSIVLAQTAANRSKQEGSGAWSGEGKHWSGRERQGQFGMLRGLNLTDDQKAKIQQIHQSFEERTKPVREQLHAKRQELHQINEGGTFNEALTTQKLQEMAGLEAKLMGEQFKLRQETLSVLTPEQKTQLEQKRQEFKNKRGGDERREQ